MARYGFFFDLTRCTGCEACTVSCQHWNGIEEGDRRFTKVSRHMEGVFPDLKATYVLNQCMHCDEPPCAAVCPTAATHKTAAGPVQVDEENCVGCRYCVDACPYGARTFNPETKTVEKCYLCVDRLMAGQQPACAATCLGGARLAGDLEDPASAISKAIQQPNVVQVAGTGIFYRLPEGISRAALPADFAAPAYVYAWQSILQPVGQVLMGGALTASLVSLAAHAFRREKDHSGGDGDGRAD